MRILLINVDARFNLALRKLYRYYHERGDQVDMQNLGGIAYPNKKHFEIDATGYDKVYVSNIFETNKDRYVINGCTDINMGGVGSNFPMNVLPDEIENLEPWYFPEDDASHGFITRGCIRKCYFCKVHRTEGYIRKVKDVKQIAQHEKVIFMDNNILAYPDHLSILQEIVDMGIKVDFNQGLDFRLVTDENLKLLSEMKYMGEYIFAFDDISYMKKETEQVKLIKKYIPAPWKLKYYIYCSPDMPLEDIIARVEWCRKWESLPYIMRDLSIYESDMSEIMIDYAAYCNQPSIFKKMTFENFVPLRHKNKERIERSLKEYKEGYSRYLEKYQ